MKTIRYQSYNSTVTIIRRHLQTIIPYLSFFKVYNIIIAKFEEFWGVEKVKALPYFLKIEPTSFCNLNCSGCLHAVGRKELVQGNLLGEMDMPFFYNVINELKKSLVKVSLYYEGEPLICENIAKMVGYLTENKIASVISTNLNYFNENLAKDLVSSRLSHLIVSLDGYDQETYSRYRQGGSFEKVAANLKLIIAEKKRAGSDYPLIEVQAIRFKDTSETHLDKIRKIAEEAGADSFLVKNDLSAHYAKPQPKKQKCFWLYGTPAIKWNGLVQPCCFYYDSQENDFGNLEKSTFSEIWNNEKFRTARRYFKDGQKKVTNLKCYDCLFFKK